MNFYEVQEIFDFLIIEQFITSINLAEKQVCGLEGATTIVSLHQQCYEAFPIENTESDSSLVVREE